MEKPTVFEQNVLDWSEVEDYIDSKHGKDFVDNSGIWNTFCDHGLTNDSYFIVSDWMITGTEEKKVFDIIKEEFPEAVDDDCVTFWVSW